MMGVGIGREVEGGICEMVLLEERIVSDAAAVWEPVTQDGDVARVRERCKVRGAGGTPWPDSLPRNVIPRGVPLFFVALDIELEHQGASDACVQRGLREA